ncbi:MAG TPA: GWxTD domain-containing protein [Acidobacteriota bacterium]|jgi:GWxTD domain-containing protein|nr:GWxTD domain-containing protein [Acidobacteriota bacterium]HJO29433.1 GWxTD domain-containing protein [Acidobacteriota bacterium]|tara:strand:- start:5543 stop:6766 length:1224 start_codon:yes stop_codon:yes gene_type:complete
MNNEKEVAVTGGMSRSLLLGVEEMTNPTTDPQRRRLFAPSIALALLMGVVLAGSSDATQVETIRTSYLGPEEGETLTSWTGRWLDGPVQYIATEEEAEIYESLGSTTQRLQFIRLFWERRDPTGRDDENAFMDQFVRRVEYANEEFSEGQLASSSVPGWQTPFGRVALVIGPPKRTQRELGLPRSVSQRPVVLWGYDARLPEWPLNEMLMFVFQRGRWRLAPPSNFGEPSSVSSSVRDMERFNMLREIPNDFLRLTQAMNENSLVRTVNYNDVINAIEANVAFPDADIPFAWTTEFASGSGDEVEVTLNLSWRMESLVFHAFEGNFETRMVIQAVLFNDDSEPVAETSEQVDFVVPIDELESRRDEIVERALSLLVKPGVYQLRVVLDDHLLGYRSVYSEALTVPGH